MSQNQSDKTQKMASTKTMPSAPPPPPRRGLTAYLPPWWAVVIMLFMVVLVSGGVVLSVVLLGGNTPEPVQPQVVVSTAPPQPTNAPEQVTLPTPTPVNGLLDYPLPTFALEGPTLAPVYISPTPDVIGVGRTVRVINVGEFGLNVRSAPGINNALLFTAREDSLLRILDGPRQVTDDSFTWWQIQDLFTGDTGWAVDIYMEVQPDNAS